MYLHSKYIIGLPKSVCNYDNIKVRINHIYANDMLCIISYTLTDLCIA